MIWFVLLLIFLVVFVSALSWALIKMDDNEELFAVHWCSARHKYTETPCPCVLTPCHRVKVVPQGPRQILLDYHPAAGRLARLAQEH